VRAGQLSDGLHLSLHLSDLLGLLTKTSRRVLIGLSGPQHQCPDTFRRYWPRGLCSYRACGLCHQYTYRRPPHGRIRSEAFSPLFLAANSFGLLSIAGPVARREDLRDNTAANKPEHHHIVLVANQHASLEGSRPRGPTTVKGLPARGITSRGPYKTRRSTHETVSQENHCT
jgi:hypothetical protein